MKDEPLVQTIPTFNLLTTYLQSSLDLPKTLAPKPYLVPLANIIASDNKSNFITVMTGAKTSCCDIFIKGKTSTNNVGVK